MKIWDFLARTTDSLAPISPEQRQRQALFSLYWDYYRGRHRKPLKMRSGQPDDNTILNYSRRVVNKGVQFLFGKTIEFEIDGTDVMTRQEEYLAQVWGSDEEKMTLLQEIALNGAVTGTAFVRLYPPQGPGSLPRIVNVDPALLDVITNDDDIDDIRSYRITWKSGDQWKRHRIDADAGQWIISEEVKGAGDRWQLVSDEIWPWDFPPVVHCQNLPAPNEFWGISDLENADINDAINFTASNINRILRFHSHPKTIGIGFNAAQLQNTAVDQFWTIPNEQAKVFNLEMQSDLASAYAYLQELRNAYSKITGVPELDPAQVNIGALSGFALRILYGDLLELTRMKRNTYGAMLNELNRRILVVSNLGDMLTRIVWQSPLPEDEQATSEALARDRQAGLSLQTYMERRGYDWKREQERIAEEQATTDTIGSALLRAFDRGGNGNR